MNPANSPRLEVRQSRIGLGAFITSSLVKGEIVADWSNHPLFEDPPRVRDEDQWVQTAPGVYSGPLGVEKNPDAYINHSCHPNCEVRIERPDIHLVALRDIAAGEEITFDYALIYEETWQMECRCGEPSCRRVVRGLRKVQL